MSEQERITDLVPKRHPWGWLLIIGGLLAIIIAMSLLFLTTPSKSITGAAVIISLATLLSRIVGIIRDRILAHYYGAGPVMDAYYAAFKIPDLIYNLLIIGALTAGFIPTFTKLFNHENGKSTAWRLASNITNIIGIRNHQNILDATTD